MFRHVMAAMAAFTLLAAAPGAGARAEQHTAAAPAGDALAIPRATIDELRTVFEESRQQARPAPGWNRLSDEQIREALAGKRVRSHDLQSDKTFDYVFYADGRFERSRPGARRGKSARWSVERGALMAGRRRYQIYTNGDFYAAVRRGPKRLAGEVFRPGEDIVQ